MPEHPQLGEPFIIGFDSGNVSFPIIATVHDPRKEPYKEDSLGTSCPHSRDWPNHVLVEIRNPSATEARILWIYRILPGPWTYSTRLDPDGAVVTVATRTNIAASITSSEALAGGTWTKTTKRGDESSYIADEVVETRAIPGNVMTSKEPDKDGITLFTTRQMKAVADITASESIVTTNWIRVSCDPISALVGWEVIVTRALPGNAIPESRLDDDGKTISVLRTLKQASTITAGETLVAGVWTRTAKEPVTDLVAYGVVSTRDIPGNSRVSLVYDNLTETVITETRQLVLASSYDSVSEIAALLTNAMTDVQCIPVDGSTLVKMLVTRVYPDSVTSKTITEFSRERYNFPALLTGYLFNVVVDNNGTAHAYLNLTIRGGKTRIVPFKTVHTFTTTEPDEAAARTGVFNPITVRHDYNGVHFNVVTGEVLNDDLADIVYTTGTGDTVWPYHIETYAFSATTPTATEYLALVASGVFQVIDRQFKKIANGLWMKTEVSCPML